MNTLVTPNSSIVDYFHDLDETGSTHKYLKTMSDEWLACQPIEIRNYLLDLLSELNAQEEDFDSSDLDGYADDSDRAESAYEARVYGEV